MCGIVYSNDVFLKFNYYKRKEGVVIETDKIAKLEALIKILFQMHKEDVVKIDELVEWSVKDHKRITRLEKWQKEVEKTYPFTEYAIDKPEIAHDWALKALKIAEHGVNIR